MTRVDWAADCHEVCRLVRAFDPKPGAFTTAPSGEVKLFGARPSAAGTPGAAPGTVIAVDGDGMTVSCGSGAVLIAAVHPSGKRRIAPQEWARGRGISPGERLF